MTSLRPGASRIRDPPGRGAYRGAAHGRHRGHRPAPVLPWVAVRNLASAVLVRGLGQLVVDWPRHFEPWLVETLVDPRRHHGGCYRAANWGRVGRHQRSWSDH